ncbi:PLP-dependent aminotransferase family protein [Desulfovibrio ferrophilus]|uniref:Transcriptional regulator, GntR family with aminotransferase domain n=1 Tax=Desulfovibrio ferrophilus TaxID=241368 RepID=A0A2Z6AZB3_9BACT|nr:PLP-dependent aminotransferase family protein [Desulfovibrio ferrophilus]BBD08558.1 transcriptional regulator, GntR family with aminotransferase domain [Desulfovibrio ferrophilus]
MPNTIQPYQYKKIEEHVLNLVESGVLQPGERLPSLRKMATTIRVSVPTVAQAYAELESRGILESRERSGFYVSLDYKRLPAPSLCPEARPGQMDMSRPALLEAALRTCHGNICDAMNRYYPEKSLLAGRCLGKILRSVIQDDPIRAVSYEPPQGNLELRKQIALRCMNADLAVSPDEIVVTPGTMSSIATLLTCITRPGDAVLIQSPAFILYLRVIETLGLRAIEIPSCPQNGIPVQHVADAIRDFDVKACLLIPNFHMDGSLTPDSSKRQIVELLAEKNIPLVEDDVYGELYFGQDRPSLFKTFDTTGLVATASSLTRTVAPGYRLGWVLPGEFKEQVLAHMSMTDARPATPMQLALGEFLRRGEFDKHMKGLRAAISLSMARMQCEIGRRFPEGTQVSRPEGGFYIWVQMPKQVDSKDVFVRAREKGVVVFPGSLLSFSDTFKNCIRINCRGVWNDDVRKALGTLGNIVTALAEQK